MCFWNFHISVVWVYRRIQSSDGIPAVVSSYTANALNQYTSRTVPDTVPITGDAPLDVNVYVNGALADRQRTHWHGTVTADNTQNPEYTEVVTEAVYLPPDPQDPDEYTATTNHVFFAQSPEVFEYDLDGNMTKDGRFNYSWNGENRLVKAETRDDLPPEVPRHRVQYAYDHQGRMVSKEVFDVSNHYPLTTTHYTWDNWNIIAETVTPLTPSSLLPATSFYVWGLDLSGTLQGAGGVGGLLAVVRDDGLFAPCYDANGNVTEYVLLGRATASPPSLSAGDIVAHYEYDAFGNITAQTGLLADTFKFRFSTKYWENETAILHYEKRPYSPSLGRWFSRDPILEQGGLNLYGFVVNDAINGVDVKGQIRYSPLPGTGVHYPDDFPYRKNPGLPTLNPPGEDCECCPSMKQAAERLAEVLNRPKCKQWFKKHGSFEEAFSVKCVSGWGTLGYPALHPFPTLFMTINVNKNTCENTDSDAWESLLIHELAHAYCIKIPGLAEFCALKAQSACVKYPE